MIAPDGEIVGGVIRDDEPCTLGIFLRHDPADFLSVAEQAFYLDAKNEDDAAPNWRTRLLRTTWGPIRQLLGQEQPLRACANSVSERLDQLG